MFLTLLSPRSVMPEAPSVSGGGGRPSGYRLKDEHYARISRLLSRIEQAEKAFHAEVMAENGSPDIQKKQKRIERIAKRRIKLEAALQKVYIERDMRDDAEEDDEESILYLLH